MKIRVDEDEFWPCMCEYKNGVEIEMTEREYTDWQIKDDEFRAWNKIIAEKYNKALKKIIRRQLNDVSNTRSRDEET